ncbi:MAG: protein-glutamine gamma-glutamyltransferase TgpA [Candidatus Pelagadaptatus aseana]|uniref:transglutaminase TgpA family protein n=1 Tax=Candidatus Pelagadaptatus aseana TaxID=3120508 RepID=UPI0039B2F99F
MSAGKSIRYLPPRNSLLWLVAALSLSILPIAGELPRWLAAIWIFVVAWRVQLFRGRWQAPSALNKVVLVIVCSCGLYLTFGRMMALEPMVSLLVCAILLKLLEMQSRKDAQLLLYLSYFVVGTQFLFDQSISALLISGACIWVITTALLVVYQPQGHLQPKRSFWLGGRLVLHSIPLMILLFLVMPRIGSLWSIPLENHGNTTGVSDSMSPGDFSNLSRAGGVAFRATFDGELPRQEELYWRGLIFSDFDGRRWQPSKNQLGTEGENWIRWGESQNTPSVLNYANDNEQPLGRHTSYEIILEPTQQRWLFSLMLATEFESPADKSIVQTTNQRLVAQDPIRQRMVYSVQSSLDYRVEAGGLPDIVRRTNLLLPEGFNPDSQEKALQWRREAGSDRAYIKRLMQFYNRSFVYTLDPPLLGRHTVDEFLWETQQGFCEHFASSFVVMMRAAGIPARVVAGYMGGEYNSLENYYVVHQYDAHAWTEVWLQGEGWVRFDPTAAVAPERVQQSLGDLQASLVENFWSLGRYRHLEFFNQLRLQWDALNYRWHKSVMGFDSRAQDQLLDNWLNGVTPLKMVLFVLGAGGAILVLMTLHLWWRSRPKPMAPALKAFARTERVLERRGFQRARGEPVGEFLRRVASANPSVESIVAKMVLMMEQALYGNGEFQPQEWQLLFKQLKQQIPRRRQLN